jgi:hypothetical protein
MVQADFSSSPIQNLVLFITSRLRSIPADLVSGDLVMDPSHETAQGFVAFESEGVLVALVAVNHINNNLRRWARSQVVLDRERKCGRCGPERYPLAEALV